MIATAPSRLKIHQSIFKVIFKTVYACIPDYLLVWIYFSIPYILSLVKLCFKKNIYNVCVFHLVSIFSLLGVSKSRLFFLLYIWLAANEAVFIWWKISVYNLSPSGRGTSCLIRISSKQSKKSPFRICMWPKEKSGGIIWLYYVAMRMWKATNTVCICKLIYMQACKVCNLCFSILPRILYLLKQKLECNKFCWH